MTRALLAVAAVVVVATYASCAQSTAPTGSCGPCFGCCASDGRCRSGTDGESCGIDARNCDVCVQGQACIAGVCRTRESPAGGGAAATGGGASATGGGLAGGAAGGGAAGECEVAPGVPRECGADPVTGRDCGTCPSERPCRNGRCGLNEIGGACSTPADCGAPTTDGGRACLTQAEGWPGGYCSGYRGCDTDMRRDPCADFQRFRQQSAVCIGSGNASSCLRSCTSNTDCPRQGHACHHFANGSVCLQACPATQCAQGQVCDGGSCVYPPPCDPNPCAHGTCTATGARTWRCACQQGWYGMNCDVPLANVTACADHARDWQCVSPNGTSCRSSCMNWVTQGYGATAPVIDCSQTSPTTLACTCTLDGQVRGSCTLMAGGATCSTCANVFTQACCNLPW